MENVTCQTCNGVAYITRIGGASPCPDCKTGRLIAEREAAKKARWMKKRGITPPAPRKAVERPPMWNETKESE